MKQEISTLMDGEMFEDEADELLSVLKRRPDTQQDWQLYHLIGDALRQPDHITRDMTAAISARLQDEPTVFAPHARAAKKIRTFALSAAASVMAIALVVWLSSQIGAPSASQQMASVQPVNAIHPASFSPNKMNDYLMAHQEFSPSTDVQGAASYMRTVATQ